MVVATIVMSTAGLESMQVLVGVAAGLAGLGVAVVKVACRFNMEDLAPWQLWRLVRLFDVASVITAAISPLILTALPKVSVTAFIIIYITVTLTTNNRTCLPFILLLPRPRKCQERILI